MIYDTFPFFNELELLEVRLHELDSVVDRFILTEANRTHSNQPKPLYFAENKERFARFLPKIDHLVVEDCPDTDDAWVIERFQRESVGRALNGCRPDDIVLNSDIDEIPRATAIRTLCERMRYPTDPLSRVRSGLFRRRGFYRLLRNLFKKYHPLVWVLEHRQYYYYLNCVSENLKWWIGTRAVFFRDFTGASDLRMWKGRSIANAGWHFSYMGGAERVQQKLKAYAHQEYNRPEYTDLTHLEKALQQGQWALGTEHRLAFVPFDDSFPAFLREHRHRFRDWIHQAPAAH